MCGTSPRRLRWRRRLPRCRRGKLVCGWGFKLLFAISTTVSISRACASYSSSSHLPIISFLPPHPSFQVSSSPLHRPPHFHPHPPSSPLSIPPAPTPPPTSHSPPTTTRPPQQTPTPSSLLPPPPTPSPQSCRGVPRTTDAGCRRIRQRFSGIFMF
jgi:hypothetical protein